MKLKNILIISVFLILITTFVGCGKKVSEVTIEDVYYTLNNEEKTAVLVKYNGNQSEVIIPETIKVKKDTYTVIRVEDKAFEDKTLTSVVLPNSLESIGKSIFGWCNELVKLEVPFIGRTADSDKDMLEYLFGGSNDPISGGYDPEVPDTLKEIIITKQKKVADKAFAGCMYLTKVVLPNSVESIGEYAFARCLRLESVVLPNDLKEIKKCTFENCINLKEIEIPNSVISIGYRAFSDCEKLEKLNLPENLTEIGSYAFKST